MPFRVRARRVGALGCTVVLGLILVACAVPDRLTVPIGDARQLVVVTSTTWSSTSGSLATYEKVGSSWKAVAVGLPVRLGRNGFNAQHHEGDGTTPAGSFPIVGMMGRQPNPGVRFPYHQLMPGDCWISDVASPFYNWLVHATPCSSPNEDLYRIGAGAYRYTAITGYNMDPIVPGAGSAIFLHRYSYDAAGHSLPTSGCVSMTEPDLLAVLRWLDPAAHPRIVMGPEAWLVLPPG
jgi:L,D-peptidoglycan transpeptidase YkuD (ErfK/YbiS/YcfS/YnhG family)